MARKKDKEILLVKWNWNEHVTPLTFIKRLAEEYKDPLSAMMDMDGDMQVSDYNKLIDLFWKFNNVLEDIKNREDD